MSKHVSHDVKRFVMTSKMRQMSKRSPWHQQVASSKTCVYVKTSYDVKRFVMTSKMRQVFRNKVNKRPTGLIALDTDNLPKVKTLLKITHLASRKSCLVIICPNSYEKLTKVKSGQIGVGLNIAQNHSSSL